MMAEKTSSVFDGLNEEQKRAVAATEGPVLIVAGAGSGKTRVLTSRVAHLLETGVEPSRILALTFTKKAAGEMKERIAIMVGAARARKVVMGTFHAVFVRFLREYAQSLGYPSQFTIYDTSDSTSAVKTCIKELQLDEKIYKPRDVLARISMAKNNLITVAAYRENQQLLVADMHAKKPKMCDLYDLYQQKLRQAGVMDFDDILVNMNILLRDNRQAFEDIGGRFSYIMVDEYQDTNHSQYIILRRLAQSHRNICVVGDDSQSIYAFRGARIENILNFRKDYPECKIFRLERNYRSTSTIVDAANSLIAHNSGRIPKSCYSMGEEGEKIHMMHCSNEADEASAVVSEILRKMHSGAAYQDFAILYRTNSQSRVLEERLRGRNIPYMIYSGNSFFDRAEVKDLMAYFKLVVNPNDDESFKRIVNKPARAIGDTSVSALNECARAHSCCLFKAAYMEDIEIYGLRPAAAQKIRAFCDMIGSLATMVATTDATVLAQKIADDSGLYAFFKADTSIEGMARTSNIEELINSVASFVEEQREEVEGDENSENIVFTLDDFLENISLLSNADTTDDDDTNNKVALMTVHSAKGLEFPYVFVTGLEDNLFPSQSMTASVNDIEEERRLFYVAITRAKKSVSLSFSDSRMRNGKHEENSPSRFLKEIDPQYLDHPLEDDDFAPRGFGSNFGGSSFGGFGSRSGSSSFASRSGNFGSRPSTGYSGGFGNRFGGDSGGRFGSGASGNGFGSGASGNGFGSHRESQPVHIQARPQGLPATGNAPDPNFVAMPASDVKVGMRIEHNRFGAGLVKSFSEGSESGARVVIDFDDYGTKVLILKYAKLRPEKK